MLASHVILEILLIDSSYMLSTLYSVFYSGSKGRERNWLAVRLECTA